MKENPVENLFEAEDEYLLLQEKITITNDFMFNRVMRKPEICQEFLQDLLPNIKIGHIEYLETQKSVESNIDARGIRLDVYAEDDQTVYNIELQCVGNTALPRRTRYYQSHIDMDPLKKGQDYDTLKESYVIFVCSFDPFGKRHYLYTFQNQCTEVKDLCLNDGTHKIFLNTKGKTGRINADLKALIAYFENKRTSSPTPLIQQIEAAVEEANQDKEWRREMMTLEMKMRDRYKAGEVNGILKGEARGIVRGKAEERNEIIKKMLIRNHPIPVIADLTGVSEEEIRAFQKNMEINKV